MTVYDAILKVSPALEGLREAMLRARQALVNARDSAPDLAPTIDAQIAKLDEQLFALNAVMAPEGLAALAMVVIEELKALVSRKGAPDSRPHPGDFAG